MNKFDFDKVYTDQSVYSTNIDNRYHFTATFTPCGIRILDCDYIRLIYRCNNVKQYKFLLKDIKDNKHLHQVIKDNLILNLTNRKKWGFKEDNYLSKGDIKMSHTNWVDSKLKELE